VPSPGQAQDAAIQALRKAVAKGVGDAAAIEAEADFESLRGEEGFGSCCAA